MATPAFNRGISEDFVNALNAEYEKGGWWRNLVKDKETFVAIRENEVHVYYRGCRLLDLRYVNDGLHGEVDYKYLLRPIKDSNKRIVKVIDGRPNLEVFGTLPHIENLLDLEALKDAVKPYSGAEKSGVHDIIHSRHNRGKVLDVEVAFGNNESKRVDFAALYKMDGTIEVRFYEAKHFSNPALTKSERGRLKVLNQVDSYSRLLNKYRSNVEESYRGVCSNLSNLSGISQRYPDRHKLLERIANGSNLTINPEVRLVVFGYSRDQWNGKDWKKHREKLKKKLDGRLIYTGNPKKLKLR